MKREKKKTQWQRFREEVLELDGGACIKCLRNYEDKAVLQVHHKKYISGCKPWEYPYSDCETLCKACHAAEHGIIPPRKEWHLIGFEDLGDLCGNCDVCGTEIRYVFYVTHLNWETLGVGEICCDDLTNTQIASNQMDSIRRFESRRKRFERSSRWSSFNRSMFIRQKGFDITISQSAEGFRIFLNGIAGKKFFSKLNEAKHFAFEFIENGDAEKYFRSKLNRKRHL